MRDYPHMWTGRATAIATGVLTASLWPAEVVGRRRRSAASWPADPTDRERVDCSWKAAGCYVEEEERSHGISKYY
jgi:hypothetical protein